MLGTLVAILVTLVIAYSVYRLIKGDSSINVGDPLGTPDGTGPVSGPGGTTGKPPKPPQTT